MSVVNPLHIATQGYLCSPLSVAVDGYICIDVDVDQPSKPGGSGKPGRSKTSYKQPYKVPKKITEEEYNDFLKRKEKKKKKYYYLLKYLHRYVFSIMY